jgi:ATP/maltotriose-dependent transcriptional regulator MalT
VPAAQVDPWQLWLAAHAAGDLWDDEGWDELNAREVSLARQVGALRALPIALTVRITIHLFAGELDLAASLASEIAGIAEATGSRMNPFGAIAVAAFQGREAETSAMIRAARQDLQPRGAGVSLTLLNLSAAFLYNGLGHYKDALIEAQQGAEYSDELSLALWCLPELVEAAVRVGEHEVAADALERLAQTTGPSGTDWALGIEARSRALLSEGERAERLYREAIERLGRSRFRAHLARAHLLYGEWLRRDNRRGDAREQLRTAHDMLTTMGIGGFAQQARAELVATGETVRRRSAEAVDQLTPQELQIARLARDGCSNSEIGTQLFVSARTVEWHLGKVYTKLGITSRKGLKETVHLRRA